MERVEDLFLNRETVVSQVILVVEDNPASMELLCDWLEGEGYDVHGVGTLDAGYAAVQARHPEAVLLDIQLGGDDALHLVSWMREQPDLASIPVIAVTAHALAPERQRCHQAGCNEVVSKPVDFHLLRRCLYFWAGFEDGSTKHAGGLEHGNTRKSTESPSSSKRIE